MIPARLAATRLPDKPLADIAGEPMIVHVWRRAMEAGVPEGRHDVVVTLQGDLPPIDPAAIAAAITPLADAAVDIATLAAMISRDEERTDPNVVKLVGSEIGANRL